MKRRIVSFLLVVVMLISIGIAQIPAVAVESNGIGLTETKVYPGDTFDVTVTAPSIAAKLVAFQIKFEFDKEALEVTTFPTVSIPGAGSTMQNNTTEANNAGVLSVSGYGLGDENTIDLSEGITVTASFKVKETAELKDYVFTITEYIASELKENGYEYNDHKPKNVVESAILTVEKRPIPVKGISIDETATVKTGETITLIPMFNPSDATNKNVVWESEDNDVATVKNGVVTGIKKGEVKITVTTEDGDHSAECIVTVNCSHINTTTHPAVESTCILQGNNAYTTCDDCGAITEGNDEKLAYADHDYQELVKENALKTAATCIASAEYYESCSVCGDINKNEVFNHGEVDGTNHVGGTYKENQKEATCFEEGYTGDIHCVSCKAKKADGEIIPKEAHNPASVWSTDETYHWKDCETVGCGTLIDKKEHNGGEATCVSAAACSVCLVEYGTIDASNHKNMQKFDAKEETCTKEGNIAYWYCNDCKKYFSDANGENEIELEDTVIPVSEHKYEVLKYDDEKHWYQCTGCTAINGEGSHDGGTATCVEKAVCEVCEQYYGSFADHDYQELAKENTLKTAATCVASAEYYKSCDVCGDINKNEVFNHGEVDDTNHVNTILVDKKEATCTEDGYTGDTYCTDCENTITRGEIIPASHTPSDWKSDDKDHWKECTVEGCGVEIEDSRNPHVESDWVIDISPEIGKEGKKHTACTVCDRTISEETIPALISYKIIEDANGTWIQDSTNEITFSSDADFSKFVEVKFDGNVLDKGAYDAKSGSTIITLKNSFLKTLSVGEHTLDIVSNDGIASTKFTIEKAKENVPSNVVSTGDSGNAYMWIGVFFVSLIGIVAMFIIGKRRKA